MSSYGYGDRVVYRKSKQKTRPARRAKHIYASPKADTYSYEIDKYCRVLEPELDGRVVLLTRRSGTLTIAATDPRLRRARWWECFFRAGLFPSWPPSDPPTSRN
jgi:hypothetical protein